MAVCRLLPFLPAGKSKTDIEVQCVWERHDNQGVAKLLNPRAVS